MKTKVSVTIILVFGLLVSCTINPHPMDMTQAVQDAKTRADHENLAKHYEDAAKEMREKAVEHKKLAAQYEANKQLYGKQAQSLISHCQGLIRIYEQAAAENMSMGELHREAAASAK